MRSAGSGVDATRGGAGMPAPGKEENRKSAEGETRTLTGVSPPRPEHGVSANFTTSAWMKPSGEPRERPLRAPTGKASR